MKTAQYIQTELKRSKGGMGTKYRHNSQFGLHYDDFPNTAAYVRALKAEKIHQDKMKLNKFLDDQLRGTIFGCGEPTLALVDEGVISYSGGEGDIL